MDEQHGFRLRRLTVTCKAVFCHYKYDDFTGRSQVDVIYTEFAKVFDWANDLALINVLCETGFGEPLLSWFSSYNHDREKWVKIHIVTSEIHVVMFCIP